MNTLCMLAFHKAFDPLPGFGVRQPSGAFRPARGAQGKRQRAAGVQDAGAPVPARSRLRVPQPGFANPHFAAFTLVELLVLIALIAIWALMLLPALARTRPNSQSSQCMNNLRQLSYGTLMYVSDNRDTFPTLASRNTYGFQVEDWIYWRVAFTNFPLAKSPIIVGFGGVVSNLFRCPTDRDDRDRLALTGPAGTDPGPYYYSYTMTGYGISGGVNLGIASVVSGTTAYPFRLGQVKNPALKIMLGEEQASLRPGEASNPSGDILNDGYWVPTSSDALTVRHNGKADVSFADGHVLPVTPQFGKNPANSRPDL